MALTIAAGHAANGGNEIKADVADDGGKPRTILKMLDPVELQVYQELSEAYPTDPVHDFIPGFKGVVEEVLGDDEVVRFIRMTNCLHDFEDPKVMDIKIGVRTFLEAECNNPKLRPDLYQKMCRKFPSEVTEAERKAEAITKHRWMTLRDSSSTITSLGYRIDGIAGYRRKNRFEVEQEISQFRTRSDTLAAFIAFCDVAATDDGVYRGSQATAMQLRIAEQMQAKLQRLRDAAARSAFLSGHEFIGTSILLVADAHGTAGVYWIDFAKTMKVEDGMQVTHMRPWELGNHEDGLIIGIDNMIQTFNKAISNLQGPSSELGKLEQSFTLGPSQTLADSEDAVELRCCGLRKARRSKKITKSQPEGTATHEVVSDVNTLSMIPSFSGTVVDNKGNIWKSGNSLAIRGSQVFSRTRSGIHDAATRLKRSFTGSSGQSMGARSSIDSMASTDSTCSPTRGTASQSISEMVEEPSEEQTTRAYEFGFGDGLASATICEVSAEAADARDEVSHLPEKKIVQI